MQQAALIQDQMNFAEMGGAMQEEQGDRRVSLQFTDEDSKASQQVDLN